MNILNNTPDVITYTRSRSDVFLAFRGGFTVDADRTRKSDRISCSSA